MAVATEQSFLSGEFLARLEKLHLVAKQLNWGDNRGAHPTVRRGSSLEFSDYRKYDRGDDLRYVDWNVYGRLNRLLLKVFTAEEEMNLYLLVDASGSMAGSSQTKMDFAKRVAAALGYIGLKAHDRVGALSFADDVVSHVPLGRSRRQILALFNFLERLPCGGQTNLTQAMKTFTLRFPRRGLVVLLSDLLDIRGCQEALEQLVKQKYDLIVVHVLGEDDLRLEPRGDLSLIDVETDRERRVFLDRDLAQRFNAEVDRYLNEIKMFCQSRGIDYFRPNANDSFEEFILRYLRQDHRVG